MKKIFAFTLVLAAVAVLAACHKKGALPREAKIEAELIKDSTVIEFVDATTFNFDTINEGDKVEHTFRIKNAGKNNLVIAEAHGDCGCTVPEYPKEPVKPGETVPIKVTFNSQGKHDVIHKTVTMTCNTANRQEKLHLEGFVVRKVKEEQQ